MVTFDFPGFLEDTGGRILRVPLEPVPRLRSVDGLREPATDVDGGDEDGLPGVRGVHGHLANGVPILEFPQGLVLGGDLIIVLVSCIVV